MKKMVCLLLVAVLLCGMGSFAVAEQAQSITLMASQNWIKDVDRELFKAFEKETGIEVKILVTPDNGYDTLLGTSLAGGSNAIDLFMYSAGSMMVSAGIPEIALDLSGEEWVARLEDWAKSVNSYQEKLYGFSTWGVDYEGILYNKTLFAENSLTVPTTWAEFMALCDKLLELGKMPLYEALNGVWHAQSWAYGCTPLMLAEDPDFVAKMNAQEKGFADSPVFLAALGQIKELLSAKNDKNEPKYFVNDGQAEDWFGSYPALVGRECAMLFTYSAYAAELATNGSKDEWGMFPVPLQDNQTAVANGGGISKFINKNSSCIEESKMLLNFLARDENLETYYKARTDLVSSAFKDVESVSATTATTDMLANSKGEIPVMFIKDVNFWDTDVYMYMQGFANNTVTPEEFAQNCDNYRATMFEAAAE
ncbi:MAG: extracellular solute-binding protein [Clostridia bacterium]